MRGGKFQREGLGIESNIFQCLDCCLVYPNPFPIPKTLESLYGDTNDYFSKKESWEVRAKLYEPLVEEFINRLGDAKKEIQLLDIGAGRGEFCQAALSFSNVNCTGTEVSLGSIQYAQERGIKLHNKSLQDLIAEGKVYDGICLNAVLAHVHEPAQFIEEASQLLSKGGLIYIDTPNEPNLFTAIGNLYNKITGSKAVLNLNPTWQPYAVYGFNSTALRVLLERNEIKIGDIAIYGDPTIPLAGGLKDKILARIGAMIQKLANLLSLGTNMYVWGKKL
tara:strand:+ start:1257 stop:2090 length:834 start_codon:yes stop_codon:yes gene_type:complete